MFSTGDMKGDMESVPSRVRVANRYYEDLGKKLLRE